MTSDALAILKLVFGPIWDLFMQIKIPGTDITPGAFAFFMLLFVFVLRFMGRMAGMSTGFSSISSIKSFKSDSKGK